jgi:hypothetical protein
METRPADRPRQYSQSLRRLVRFAVRGNRIVEGNVHVTEGQSLSVYLTTRRVVANLTEARWMGPDVQVMSHLAIRTEKILWAASLDEALPVTTNLRPPLKPRWVEFMLDDDVVMDAALFITEEQRLTDYFDAAPAFLPLLQSTIVGSQRLLGPLAINTHAIVSIREVEPPPASESR